MVVVDDVDMLPSDLDRESLRRVGTRSNVAAPIFVDGELLGALTVASLGAPRPVTPALKDAMRLLGQVFGQALQHRHDQQELTRALHDVSHLRDMFARDNELLYREVKQLRWTGEVTAESAAARETLQMVEQVAPTGATVLLLGETGVGKEVFAKEIHARSPRAKRPMVRVNCGAIPTALIESELFGREKGAYTGAVSRQVGRFEMADGSTIFLDEIGELPLEAQVKLLRVLQDRVVERLGSTQPIKVDVRIIAATNRNLEDAVAARTFREDLFYRLNVFPITVPPLRERVEDIPALVWTFIEECSKHFGKTVTSVSRESMESLQRYPWPGNIRELRNTVEHAMIVANSPKLIDYAADGSRHGAAPQPQADRRGGGAHQDRARQHRVACPRTRRSRRTAGREADDARGPHGASRRPPPWHQREPLIASPAPDISESARGAGGRDTTVVAAQPR